MAEDNNVWDDLDRIVPNYPEDDDDLGEIRSIINRRRDIADATFAGVDPGRLGSDLTIEVPTDGGEAVYHLTASEYHSALRRAFRDGHRAENGPIGHDPAATEPKETP